MKGTVLGCLFMVFFLAIMLLGGLFFVKMAMEPLPVFTAQQPAAQPQNEPTLPVMPVPAREWHILRIPQTVGLAPSESGVTQATPYNTTLPAKLANIPSVTGRMYGDTKGSRLQDIIAANEGRDIVVSFGDTWCGACLGVIRTFGEFEANYGNLVAFVGVFENDPGRLKTLINKYRLNPDVIFVSDIDNLDSYHAAVLQGFMYRPIVVHINPEGKVDRVLISSFGSVENLKKFIGIDLQEVN